MPPPAPRRGPVPSSEALGAFILVVESDPAYGRLFLHLLGGMGYANVALFREPEAALEEMRERPTDLLVVDHRLPGTTGMAFVRRLAEERLAAPVLMTSTDLSPSVRHEAYEAGVTDFLPKPFDRLELGYKVGNLLRVVFDQRRLQGRAYALERLVEARTAELQAALRAREESYEEALKVVGAALESRDYETKGHTDRVTLLAGLLAERVGLAEEDAQQLRWGAYLHDIGKIAIPDQILLKPGKLTPDEYLRVQSHVIVGEAMLRPLGFLGDAVLRIVRHHHERWDGLGYPDGLRGEAIPLLTRIFSVADVYDALISPRPYKSAWPQCRALEELERNAGRQFDPELVSAFVGVAEAYEHL